MSIPRPELDGAALSQGIKDPFGPDLVARLANELFQAAPCTVATPSAPTPPSTLAGLPSAPELPMHAVPPVSRPSSELSGGFPTTSPSTPPVHPVLERSDAKSDRPSPATTTGAHNPESRDSYAFGEPRLRSLYRGDSSETKTTANPKPLATTPASFESAGQPVIASHAGSVHPVFYFIRETPRETQATSLPPVSSFDVDVVRRDFPILHQDVNGHPLIWLDNAATTQKPRQVIDATSSFYSRDNSNIHRAAYALAERSTKLFEAGREKVRQFLGARDAKEIVFLRGTTEGITPISFLGKFSPSK